MISQRKDTMNTIQDITFLKTVEVLLPRHRVSKFFKAHETRPFFIPSAEDIRPAATFHDRELDKIKHYYHSQEHGFLAPTFITSDSLIPDDSPFAGLDTVDTLYQKHVKQNQRTYCLKTLEDEKLYHPKTQILADDGDAVSRSFQDILNQDFVVQDGIIYKKIDEPHLSLYLFKEKSDKYTISQITIRFSVSENSNHFAQYSLLDSYAMMNITNSSISKYRKKPTVSFENRCSLNIYDPEPFMKNRDKYMVQNMQKKYKDLGRKHDSLTIEHDSEDLWSYDGKIGRAHV